MNDFPETLLNLFVGRRWNGVFATISLDGARVPHAARFPGSFFFAHGAKFTRMATQNHLDRLLKCLTCERWPYSFDTFNKNIAFPGNRRTDRAALRSNGSCTSFHLCTRRFLDQWVSHDQPPSSRKYKEDDEEGAHTADCVRALEIEAFLSWKIQLSPNNSYCRASTQPSVKTTDGGRTFPERM